MKLLNRKSSTSHLSKSFVALQILNLFWECLCHEFFKKSLKKISSLDFFCFGTCVTIFKNIFLEVKNQERNRIFHFQADDATNKVFWCLYVPFVSSEMRNKLAIGSETNEMHLNEEKMSLAKVGENNGSNEQKSFVSVCSGWTLRNV